MKCFLLWYWWNTLKTSRNKGPFPNPPYILHTSFVHFSTLLLEGHIYLVSPVILEIISSCRIVSASNWVSVRLLTTASEYKCYVDHVLQSEVYFKLFLTTTTFWQSSHEKHYIKDIMLHTCDVDIHFLTQFPNNQIRSWNQAALGNQSWEIASQM